MKTKNLAVGILAGVLLVALWYTMLLKPTRAKVTDVKAETQVQEDKLAPLQSQLALARADAANAAEIKAQLASLQEAMPDTPALAAFIRDANGIAGGSGGFSTNSRMRPLESQSITPNAEACARGTGSAATVTSALQARWKSIICCRSMRYT